MFYLPGNPNGLCRWEGSVENMQWHRTAQQTVEKAKTGSNPYY